jgi:hypothetical protein
MISCRVWLGGDSCHFLGIIFCFLWVLVVSSFLCCSVLMEVYRLIEGLKFFHNIFRTLGLYVDFKLLF